jgi:hypothetical protein
MELKKYQCHKQVHARPMTRLKYNQSRGWELPEDEDGDDEGYRVVYDLGTDMEYISWSPKFIFEAGYDRID